MPIFAPLSASVLERLAARLVPAGAAACAVILRQADHGDRFYVLASGEVEVTQDDGLVAVQGPGGYFGEIALLRNVPRTATVRARTDVRLYVLERDDVLEAVTGHPGSVAAAGAGVHARFDDRVRRQETSPGDPDAADVRGDASR